MEEVVGSNPTRSTKTFHRLTVPASQERRRRSPTGVPKWTPVSPWLVRTCGVQADTRPPQYALTILTILRIPASADLFRHRRDMVAYGWRASWARRTAPVIGRS